LKIICNPEKITEAPHEKIPNEIQEVYDIQSMKTINYFDGKEKFYQTNQEINNFFLMEKDFELETPPYNDYYKKYYINKRPPSLFNGI